MKSFCIWKLLSTKIINPHHTKYHWRSNSLRNLQVLQFVFSIDIWWFLCHYFVNTLKKRPWLLSYLCSKSNEFFLLNCHIWNNYHACGKLLASLFHNMLKISFYVNLTLIFLTYISMLFLISEGFMCGKVEVNSI